MQALTLIDPEVEGDILPDREEETDAEIEEEVEGVVIPDNVVKGLAETDTVTLMRAVVDILALSLGEPELVEKTVPDLDVDVDAVVE